MAIYEKILREKLSVRQTEELVKSLKVEASFKKFHIHKTVYIKNSLKDISEYFGHKIDVKISTNGKGKILIPFHSEEDFEPN